MSSGGLSGYENEFSRNVKEYLYEYLQIFMFPGSCQLCGHLKSAIAYKEQHVAGVFRKSTAFNKDKKLNVSNEKCVHDIQHEYDAIWSCY
jgi:hypothetical protein